MFSFHPHGDIAVTHRNAQRLARRRIGHGRNERAVKPAHQGIAPLQRGVGAYGLQSQGGPLQAVPGIGPHAAVLLQLMRPLWQRFQRSQLQKGESLLTGDRLCDYCAALLMGEPYERLYVLALDDEGKLLASTQISAGDEGETAVYPRLIVAALLRAKASQAVLCHNHPAGDPTPSKADRQMTEALKQLLAPLHIALYDHVVVGAQGCFSLRRMGLL